MPSCGDKTAVAFVPWRILHNILFKRELRPMSFPKGQESEGDEPVATDERLNVRQFDREFELTNRLRTQGTDNLIVAAQAAGTSRFVAQSYAAWPYTRVGGPIKSESDPLDPHPPAAMRKTLEAIVHLEVAVLGAQGMKGIVLRYGAF